MVTAQEAKRILEHQRKRNRERQREFAKAMRAEGYRKVQSWISGEAYERLEAMRAEGMTTTEAISQALMEYHPGATRRADNATTRPRATKSIGEPPPPPPIDDTRLERLARIKELKDAGWTAAQIADRFNAEDIPTPSGRGQWSKTAVNNQVSKNRDFFGLEG